MGKSLAVNAGSSSLKWQLYAMPEEEVLAKGLIERIGLDTGYSTVAFAGQKTKVSLHIPDHTAAVKLLLETLKEDHIIADFSEITGIGHRVVAGGERFKQSEQLDDTVIQEISDLSVLAPLHNPGAVEGMRAFQEVLPEVFAIAVFDTAFHTTMPEKAYRYPIAEIYYTDYKVRKYGAHGTSHQYVAQEAARFLGKSLSELKLITCHIGNGVSVTAVDRGISVDTSMGLTPLGGVMMGTRTGDMDPAVTSFILAQDPHVTTAQEMTDIYNRQSGLLGVSEVSSDMRDILEGINQGNEKCRLAYEMYIDRLQKMIGAYLAVLNGADAIVFTAGIGENSAPVRRDILKNFTWAGLLLDDERNETTSYGQITTDDSKLMALVIPTDEELMIVRDIERLRK